MVLTLFCAKIQSQDFFWKAGVYSFFDNVEFSGSEYKMSQTMSGIQAVPEVGIKFDTVHLISAGGNALHEFGGMAAVERFYPVIYYEFDRKPYRFLMGAFPRSMALDKYPRVFFQDSVSYFRPNMNGVFWEISGRKGYVNLWLDWTGQRSPTEREAFFAGVSGRYGAGIFYLQHFDYMFHYAKDFDPIVDRGIHDNMLTLTSAGIDLSGLTFLDRLDINAGWLAGVERARAENSGWLVNSGFFMETRLAYKRVGVFNSLYAGDAQMKFYADHGNGLYWGDPAYRAGNYNRTDLCVDFINSGRVRLNLTYSLHFAEGNVYHEQLLKAQIMLNNIK